MPTYHAVERRRYALVVSYDGGAFRGWQRQPGLPSVQEALESALAAAGVAARLAAAARTDAGAHALAQVASFSARAALDPAALRAAVNRATPAALVCREAREVPLSFHARASATSRRYAYLVGLPPPQGLAPYAWTLPDERAFPGVRPERLDVGAMRRALAGAIGRHDFAGFARPGEGPGSVRTLLSAEVHEAAWAPLWAVVFEGRGFVRAMVRNLVGTAVAVGLGLAPPSRVEEILRGRERYRGVRAPAWGLTLAAVRYPAGALDT